jgi:hypothetical protein
LLIVERVVKVFPQLQVTAISLYLGCVSIFMGACLACAVRTAARPHDAARQTEAPGNPRLSAKPRH